jgi:hypothetical protein
MTVPMTLLSVYHNVVNGSVHRSIRSLLALSGVLLLPLLLAFSSPAQISSASSSSSAHSGSVASASVTSIAHNGYVPSNLGATHPTHPTNAPHFPGGSPNTSEHHRPHHGANGIAYYPYLYAVPFPYAADVTDPDAPNDDNNDDSEYQGGPTVFDRRGSGAASYVPPHYEGPAHASQEQSARMPMEDESDAARNPEPPPSPTVLVFKDGRELEVENYAIVAQTLYDLTPGHPRKIALSDIDLPATQKHNDDRGVTFQLPPSAQGN